MKKIFLTFAAILGIMLLAPQASHAGDPHFAKTRDSYTSYELMFDSEIELEVYFENNCGTSLMGKFIMIPRGKGRQSEPVLFARFQPWSFLSGSCKETAEAKSEKIRLKPENPHGPTDRITVIVPDFLSVRINKVENQ